MPFTAESTAGTVQSGDHTWLVLYFYPRDNTPGCTTEGQDFTAAYRHFKKLGAEVMGVSADSLASHEKFAAKQGFPFPLITDPEQKLCEQFEVIKEKNMYGKKYRGIERSTFILDGEGQVVREWRKVKVSGHVDAVLEALRELAG
ncbi:MAG: peroxiredoxin [Gammaproteobacteria bacterium AqS3]|nr:peroxiredoxin [Gammaproteobacteria bacterium AqS3]